LRVEDSDHFAHSQREFLRRNNRVFAPCSRPLPSRRGSNPFFFDSDLHCHAPESGDLWFKPGRLKRATRSMSPAPRPPCETAREACSKPRCFYNRFSVTFLAVEPFLANFAQIHDFGGSDLDRAACFVKLKPHLRLCIPLEQGLHERDVETVVPRV